MTWRVHLWVLVVISAAACVAARADEIRLKDGSKIVGTIVGYEDGAFKVETSYGFAIVSKTSIAEIVPADTTKASGTKPEAKSADPVPPKPPTKTAAQPAAPAPKPAGKPAAQTAGGNASPPGASQASSRPDPSSTPGAPAAPAAAPPVPAAAPVVTPAAAPAPPPKPVPIQEMVSGNLYTNRTYGFSMYKPPAWENLSDRSTMPEAITALGTSDRSTLLLIGRDNLSSQSNPPGSSQSGDTQLDARATATERKLRDVYDNYRPLTLRHLNIAGLPAVERHFRGNADGHDWSVVAVTLLRGNEAFTILGMTYADSDLIQLQENVINKAVTSLQFTP